MVSNCCIYCGFLTASAASASESPRCFNRRNVWFFSVTASFAPMAPPMPPRSAPRGPVASLAPCKAPERVVANDGAARSAETGSGPETTAAGGRRDMPSVLPDPANMGFCNGIGVRGIEPTIDGKPGAGALTKSGIGIPPPCIVCIWSCANGVCPLPQAASKSFKKFISPPGAWRLSLRLFWWRRHNRRS